jgi:hypothetical protein
MSMLRRMCMATPADSADHDAQWSELGYTSYGLTRAEFDKKFTRLPRLEAVRACAVIDETMRRVSADV